MTALENRILVVEKDEVTREMIRMRLVSRHYQVDCSDRADIAVKLLDRESYDLIIIAQDLDLVSGQTLIQVVRTKPHLTATPVILMVQESQITDLLLSSEKGYDDFLTKPINPLVLQLRVKMNVERVRERVEVNALTYLPGNHAIEKVVLKKIKSGEKYSVLYFDINHFKAFNDRCGFHRGDDALRHTAKLLTAVAQELRSQGECFVGHVGGDDFVAVMPVQVEEKFARRFIEDFDRIMPTYYNEEDQKRGSIRVKNRSGKMEDTPLMSCSVAACTNLYRTYQSLGEIASDAAEVKSFLKTQSGSHYLRDRRSAPPSKIEDIEDFLKKELPDPNKKSIDPLGQILIGAGLLTEAQLEIALTKHFETGQRLGQCLISMNLVSSEDVGRMLEKRLNVPYFSLKKWRPSREILRMFTFDFVEAHRVVPVEVTSGMIKLAMCDPFDLKLLDRIEQITRLKPVPCLTLEDEFEVFLNEHFRADSVRTGDASRAL